jgi:hypothetical protein
MNDLSTNQLMQAAGTLWQRRGKQPLKPLRSPMVTFSADTCGAHHRTTPYTWPGSLHSPFPMCPPSDILDTPSVSQSCTLSPLLSRARCRLSCPVFLLVSVAQPGELDSGIFHNLRPWADPLLPCVSTHSGAIECCRPMSKGIKVIPD